jgi:hypothetical protein
MMRLFILISWLLLQVSCIAGQNTLNVEINPSNINGIPVFTNGTKEAVFRGTMEVYKHYYSGIFAVKKEAVEKFRVVLMSEVGMTLLDFSFDTNVFEVIYCIEPLNKKGLLKLLYHDFLLLVNTPNPKELKQQKCKCDNAQSMLFKKKNNRDFYCFENGEMKQISSKKILNHTLIQFQGMKTGAANLIQIKHSPFKLKMELTRI